MTQEPDKPPLDWRLIAVLGSTFSLSPALARWLYETAVDLHLDGRLSTRLAGDLGEGMARDLEEEVLFGTLSGRAFEARIEGPEGSGQIRFIVTRLGIDEGRKRRDQDRKVRQDLN